MCVRTGAVILGDTQDPYAIAEACFQCHVLVHECTFDAHSKEMALDRGHSTSGWFSFSFFLFFSCAQKE